MPQLTPAPGDEPPFAHRVVRLGRAIEERSRALELPGFPAAGWEIARPEEAIQALLIHVAATSVREAPDLLLGRSGDEDAVRAVVFLYFAALPLHAMLRREGRGVDVHDVVTRSAAIVLQRYGQEHFTRLVLRGRARLRQLLDLPTEHPVARWSQGVNTVVLRAADTGDAEALRPLAELYVLLGEVEDLPPTAGAE